MTDKLDPRSKAFKEIKWIPIKNLSVVWAEAQRPLNEKHAQSIADDFDPEMFGVLSVTKPNGHGIYHLIDGHHRKVAIEKKWGVNENVPCQVFEIEDPARAAELFDHINSGRKAIQPLDLFRVRVTSGEEIQVEVNRIVRKCGFFLERRSESAIACVGALETVYQSYGPIILEHTLKLIKGIWGDDNSAGSAAAVRGFGMFLSEFRNVDFDKLVKAIAAKYTPARFLGAARAGKEVNGGSIAMAVRDLTIATYNGTIRGEKYKLQSKKK